ncbi:MAG: S41 family peptidase [Anaerococcus sp.]|nr:S41 family peptidase [Anaerococcus sp.]
MKDDKKRRRTKGKKPRRKTKSTSRQRRLRLKKKRRAKFIRRRIILGLGLLLILLIPLNFLYKGLTSYRVMGYPDFREEVLEGLSSQAIVSSTKGRSLSSQEKLDDFDKLYDLVIRNYGVSNENKENFLEFAKSKDDFRKRILNSKTDQEFFEIINELMGKLKDPQSFILNKDTYDNLFDHFKNIEESNRSKLLGNDQVRDRYKRMIGKENKPSPMVVDSSNPGLLVISLPDFSSKHINDDIKTITDELTKKEIDTIAFDLSDNKSIDYIYANKLLSFFIDKDYIDQRSLLYRGHIFEQSLDDMKNIDISAYKTAFARNSASRLDVDNEHFDKDSYIFYDQVELTIKKDPLLRDRKIYILTNEESANEAIRFAYILKESGAYVSKNALATEKDPRELVSFLPSDLFYLDHSGLVGSISAKVDINPPVYLQYDQRINSDNPYQALVDIAK